MRKILIFGASGQLGKDIVKELKNDSLITFKFKIVEASPKMRIENYSLLEIYLKEMNPQIVINCAAFANVNECEEINPIYAFEVNSIGAMNVAKLSKKLGFTNFYISTDYVFDGKNPDNDWECNYTEDATPNPLNVYGMSKYVGELFTKLYCDKYFIIRTSGLYGINECKSKGSNFIKSVLNLAKTQKEISIVDDEYLTPTSTEALARQIGQFILEQYNIVLHYGIYHMTSNGNCSWYEFTKEMFKILDITDVKIKPISSKEFHNKNIMKPSNSVLCNFKLKNQSVNIDIMPDWKTDLYTFLTKYKGILCK